MLSVSGKNWEEIKINNRIVEQLKNEKKFSEIVSKLIISNNFDELEINTINEKIPFQNPFKYSDDFIQASSILKNSINNNDKIIILGDYDVDGCVSTSLLVNFLNELNYKFFSYYIPNRFNDGYGADLDLIKNLEQQKPNLIILVDCGSTSNNSIDYLKSRNIKTIIIDHHEIHKPYPKANCIINPKKIIDYSSYDYVCASFLVYFFIDKFINKNKLRINFSKNLPFVLLSTIADVMPLRKLNRVLAIEVFNNKQNNFFFNQFLEINKINRPLEIDDLGYLIAPILNSAGRLGDPNIVVDLLTSKNSIHKENIIKKLIKTNEKRKKIENDYLNEINISELKKNPNNVLILSEMTFNEGVIGIIAARLKEYFNKPSIVITKTEKGYKASARSTPNFNIGKFIKEALDENLLLKGGGHNLAAGFSIDKSKIKDFEKFINNKFKENNIFINNKYISKISLNAVNVDFYNDLKKLAPFGSGNPNPIFLIENVKIIKPQLLKNKYVSFYIKSKFGKLIQGFSFNILESAIKRTLLYSKKELSLIVQIKENNWKNKKKLQLILLDVIDLPNKA